MSADLLSGEPELIRVLGDVADERVRQEGKGYSAAHDDKLRSGELGQAAAAYATYAALQIQRTGAGRLAPPVVPDSWPFWTAGFVAEENPRDNLIKAIALAVAEVERLDRLEANLWGHLDEPDRELLVALSIDWNPVPSCQRDRRSVDRLRCRGLIAQQRRPADGGRVFIRLTPMGAAVREKGMADAA